MADDNRGCGNVAMMLIRSGTGVGMNDRVSKDDFQWNCLPQKNQNQHNTTTNLSFEGGSRTPSWRDGWEDNEPTRGSKLHELTEIEGDDCPHERKSHCCGFVMEQCEKWGRVVQISEQRTIFKMCAQKLVFCLSKPSFPNMRKGYSMVFKAFIPLYVWGRIEWYLSIHVGMLHTCYDYAFIYVSWDYIYNAHTVCFVIYITKLYI